MKEKIIRIEDFANKDESGLKSPTSRITFPLSDEDKKIINLMEEILFSLEGVGLAAPQIGISKSIAAIYIPETAALLRNNVITYPMHTIINGEYEPVISDGKYSDFEACYSVKTVCGNVQRYNTVKLKYQDEEGKEIVSIQTGFYARVLQHEIDHLNGILITDRLTPWCKQGSLKEMSLLRRELLSEEQRDLFDKLTKQKGLA